MENVKIIAHIHTDFPEKFGVPRQSGLVKDAIGTIVFETKYRDPSYIKGLEEFTHLWLLWEFEGVKRTSESALVRPPRLGGNETRGVFATRSPFRPNPIGLSSVKIESIDYCENGPVITVSGVDMRDNTPIIDIKPYLAYADAHVDASNGFAGDVLKDNLSVVFPGNLLSLLPPDKQAVVISVLSEDPRPHYQNDPEREYGLSFLDFNIKFRVNENILTVFSVEKTQF